MTKVIKKLDKLFINGKIYTLEDEGVHTSAIGIKDGIVVETGNTEDLLAKYESNEIIDLEGGVMLPGMGDSHMHMFAYCQTLTTVDLSGATSKAEIIKRLSDKAKETPKGEWIKGSNFDQSKWIGDEDILPTKEDLDEASKEHKIVIKRVCLHTAVANSLALKDAGITEGFVYGEGGTVELNKDGSPNGVLREQATKIFDEIIPDPLNDKETKMAIMEKALKEASSLGVTMMHTYAANIWKYTENFEDYLELDKVGKLPLRITICLDEFFEKRYISKKEMADPFRKVQYGSFKIFCDGSLGSRSAKLYEPYDDDKNTDGILVISQEDLNNRVLEGYKMGLQPAIHCIGDKGLDNVLTSIEYTLEQVKKEGMTDREINNKLPFRIIHAQMATKELIERMSRLPVIVDMQPSFLITDMHWIEDRVGKERAQGSYQWKTYKDAGIMLLGGSDCPVELFSPWEGIFAAVTRKDKNLYPDSGYNEAEKLSIYEGVCAFSKNIPYANGEEDYIGTLEAGKFADMIVIDRDIFEREPEDILNVQVKETYLAGKKVF
ncbi:MAG: amidohydrolase [Anaerovoracaceae bacterium]